MKTFIALFIFSLISLALSSRVYSVGQNNNGQLGTGNQGNNILSPKWFNLTSVDINGTYTNPTLVACGGDFSVIYSADNGTFWTFGANNLGQLGDGTTVNSRIIPQLANLTVSGSATIVDQYGNKQTVQKAVVQMEGSVEFFVVVLLNDNTLWTWGLDWTGRLGRGVLGSFTAQRTPVQVKNNNIQTEVITQIAVGASHTLVLCQSGKLYAFGRNQYGQLGDGSTVDKPEPTAVQLSSLGTKTIISIKARGEWSMLLTKDGFAYSWGYNGNFNLGDGTNTTRITPTLVTGDVFGANQDPISLIAAGRYHAIAYSSTTNTYYSWGDNRFGQLGNGTLRTFTTPVNGSAIRVLMAQYNDVPVQLAAGDSTTFIWGKSGKIYAFGLNGNGQLGESSQTTQLLGNVIDMSPFNGSITAFCNTYQHGLFITNSSFRNIFSLAVALFVFVTLLF